MSGDVFSAEGNQLICESSESVVYGVDLLSFVSLESIEFASKGVNSGIFLSGNSFSNLFKIVPDTFGKWDILHFMILLWSQMICDEYPDFRIKIHQLCFIGGDGLLVLDSDSTLDNSPGS